MSCSRWLFDAAGWGDQLDLWSRARCLLNVDARKEGRRWSSSTVTQVKEEGLLCATVVGVPGWRRQRGERSVALILDSYWCLLCVAKRWTDLDPVDAREHGQIRAVGGPCWRRGMCGRRERDWWRNRWLFMQRIEGRWWGDCLVTWICK